MTLAGSGCALGEPWHLEQVKYFVGAGVHGVTLIIEWRLLAVAALWGNHGILGR